MGISTKAKAAGIDVALHAPDMGCGNPCHPGHTCSSCADFWQTMLATGRFKAYVPPTFDGSAPTRKEKFAGTKIDFADLTFRTKGSNS